MCFADPCSVLPEGCEAPKGSTCVASYCSNAVLPDGTPVSRQQQQPTTSAGPLPFAFCHHLFISSSALSAHGNGMALDLDCFKLNMPACVRLGR